MTEEYYPPASIVFSRPQIIWIISNIEIIESGTWPPDFKVTGYTGGKKGRRFGPAYFEIPLTISAEVKRRLEITKRDGKILYWQIRSGITRFEDLEPEAQCALNYISLWDFRRRQSYSNWAKQRRYRKKLQS